MKTGNNRGSCLYALALTALWLLPVFLALEVYSRAGAFLAAQRYVAGFKVKKSGFTFSEASDETLWEIPWWKYKKNAEIKLEQNGLQLYVKTNSYGFRSPDLQVPKPRGTYRIVCVGGSTTVEGLSNQSTYPALLERRLREHFQTERIDVVNCGISGLAAEGELKKADSYFALEPDLILEYNGANDICWGVFPLLQQRASWWQKIARESSFVNDMFNWYLQPAEDDIRELIRSRVISFLATFARTAKSRGCGIIFCTFCRPDINNLSKDDYAYYEVNTRRFWQGDRHYVSFATYCRLVDIYNDELKKMCKATDVPVMDVAARGLHYSESFSDICHLNDTGICKKAESIFSLLAPLLAHRFLPQNSAPE